MLYRGQIKSCISDICYIGVRKDQIRKGQIHV